MFSTKLSPLLNVGFSSIMKVARPLCSQRRYSLAMNYISNDKKEFMTAFGDVVNDLTHAGNKVDLLEMKEWFSKVLHYNLSSGKKLRGLIVVYCYKMLSNSLTEEDLRLACTLGWCMEMFHAYFLVLDDIMDGSESRRGKPAWYRLPEVGVSFAINDALMLQSGVFELLKLHVKGKPYYLDLLELFHEGSLTTEYGQGLDVMMSKNATTDLTRFDMNRYKTIAQYKTSFYTFYMPFATAMYMAGLNDPILHEHAKQILFKIGEFFQIQDDFIDVFSDPKVSGKHGTDIKEGKCSWPAIVALDLCNEEQRHLFQQSYGYDDPDKIRKIKSLYIDLGIPSYYKTYEEETFKEISSHIKQLDRLPQEIFYNLLQSILNRTR